VDGIAQLEVSLRQKTQIFAQRYNAEPFSWEALPDGEANRNGWVEVSTRRRTTGYDSKGDTNSVSKSDLEDGAESRFRSVDEERGLGSNARITALGSAWRIDFMHHIMVMSLHVEENTGSFCKHLAKPSWPRVFEV
jgi:hypothetical protein